MSESTNAKWARANRKTDTNPEVKLRSLLHRQGFRFRKNASIRVPGATIRADIVFRRAKIAVFVDGCFWHCCPQHGGRPRSNADYWASKFARNVQRDRWVNAQLEATGWTVVRIWEHVAPVEAADLVAQIVSAARASSNQVRS